MVKPGYKTTEFYLALGVQALSVLVLFGWIKPTDAAAIGTQFGDVVTALGTIWANVATWKHYINARTAAKAIPPGLMSPTSIHGAAGWVAVGLVLFSGEAHAQWCPGGNCPPPFQQPYQPRPQSPAQSQNVPAELVAASVKIQVHGGHGGSGTVVFVDEAKGAGLVLTNAHVVANGKKATITFPSGYAVEGDILAVDKDKADLGTIAIPADRNTPCVPLAPACPLQGAEICQVGYGGWQMQRRRGTILGYREPSPGDPHYQMILSFQVISGDSGSGVFSVKDKQLVGVVWGGSDYNAQPGRALNFEPQAVTLVNVRRFVLACQPRLLPWRRKIEGEIGRGPSAPSGGHPVIPAPPGNTAPPGTPNDNGLADIQAQIAALKSQIAGGSPGTPGLAGPPGKDGAPGAPGPRGPVGPPGPSVDIASLQAQIEQLRLTVSAQAPGALRVRVVPK